MRPSHGPCHVAAVTHDAHMHAFVEVKADEYGAWYDTEDRKWTYADPSAPIRPAARMGRVPRNAVAAYRT